MTQAKKQTTDVEELDAARSARRVAGLRASMSERLARVHELSKQLTAIKDRAKRS